MIMVTAEDSGASLTARRERGAAGAALGGRGERAEKADSGAPQPHIEGTFIYVIARCAPGSVVSGDVARRATRGRGHAMARPERAAGIRGLGRDTMRSSSGCARQQWPSTESAPRACGDGKGLAADRRPAAGVAARVWPGCGCARLPPSSHPFLGKKMSAELYDCCPARRCGEGAGMVSRVSNIRPTAAYGLFGLRGEGDVVGTGFLVGSESQSLR